MSRMLPVAVAAMLLAPACMAASSRPPECDPSSPATILLAQSVPTAVRVPCLRELPLGWRFDGMRATDDGAEMWLSTSTGGRAVTIAFAETCDVGDAEPVEPGIDESGAEVFVDMTSDEPPRGARYVRFEGGCITTTYAFPPGSTSVLVNEADDALSHVSRIQIVQHVAVAEGTVLCGVGAAPCLDG